MGYAKKRAEGKTSSEIYAEIRKAVLERSLETGKRWGVTVHGIPTAEVSTRGAKELIIWLEEHVTPAERSFIYFYNILTEDVLSVEEMKKNHT